MSGPSVCYSRALGYQICAAYRLSHVALNAIAASRFGACLTAGPCVLALVKFRDSKTSGIFGYASIGIKDAPEITTVAENDVADVAIVRV